MVGDPTGAEDPVAEPLGRGRRAMPGAPYLEGRYPVDPVLCRLAGPDARRRVQVGRLRDAHARAANHDNVFHLRRQIGGGQTHDHRPVAVADHRDLRLRAQNRQILGESFQQCGAGSCQLFARRISADTLWRVVPEPGDHGDVLARRRRASGVIQGLRLNRRGTVSNVPEAGVEVVRAIGHTRNEHGDPVRSPQIAEHLDDPAVATRVEPQELTPLSRPMRVWRPGSLHGLLGGAIHA